jgi:hypothetical protein
MAYDHLMLAAAVMMAVFFAGYEDYNAPAEKAGAKTEDTVQHTVRTIEVRAGSAATLRARPAEVLADRAADGVPRVA